MLSFNSIGNLGRLANQMFQYASLKGIANNRNLPYCIPPREVFGNLDENVRGSDQILYDVFDIESKNTIKLLQQRVHSERFFHFDSELFNKCPDNVDLQGYYQTEKYFKHIKEDIKKDFAFKEELLKECKQFVTGDMISLHIRRGDYVTNPNHPTQTMEYYKEALSNLPNNLPVAIFSDDPAWCKKQELFAGDRFMIAEGNSTDCDLCLMSLCSHHIIANSSYSWWGAWLADSKRVIAPKKWFGGQCLNKKTKDIYCEGWLTL